jgi:hypothetical protein
MAAPRRGPSFGIAALLLPLTLLLALLPLLASADEGAAEEGSASSSLPAGYRGPTGRGPTKRSPTTDQLEPGDEADAEPGSSDEYSSSEDDASVDIIDDDDEEEENVQLLLDDDPVDAYRAPRRASQMRGGRVIDRIARGAVGGMPGDANGLQSDADAHDLEDSGAGTASRALERSNARSTRRDGTADPIEMWQSATLLFTQKQYRPAEKLWLILAQLLAPDTVDAAFNYALCLERQDRCGKRRLFRAT